jgi:hypothetical protein
MIALSRDDTFRQASLHGGPMRSSAFFSGEMISGIYLITAARAFLLSPSLRSIFVGYRTDSMDAAGLSMLRQDGRVVGARCGLGSGR